MVVHDTDCRYTMRMTSKDAAFPSSAELIDMFREVLASLPVYRFAPHLQVLRLFLALRDLRPRRQHALRGQPHVTHHHM